jgi:hypothetical protein
LGTNFPLGAELGALLVVVAALPAAFPDEELSREPPRAPPTSEPASTVARIHFFAMFIDHLLPNCVLLSFVSRARRALKDTFEFDVNRAPPRARSRRPC